jgi:nitroimidazol reductase NimA-like FMN-containing flavoprotein (pyridoxamine 5'-phosphate oxidase superfamily)
MVIPRELTTEEAIGLISPVGVGRLGFGTPGRQEIVPLNYVVDGASIVFRTAPYSMVGTHDWPRPVAFEIDRLDVDKQRGWSVIVRGTLRRVEDPDEIESLAVVADPAPWAGGMRRAYFRLLWSEITGRVVGEELLPARDISNDSRWQRIEPWSIR